MKRLLGIFVFIFLASFIFTKSIFAQDTSTYPMRVNSDVPKNLHTYTQTVVLELLSAFSCQLSGIDPLNPKGQCLGADSATGKIGFVKSQGGLLGFFSGSIDGMYKIPISSGDYISYLSSNFGIVKKANAQLLVLGPGGPTSGYNGLKWMQSLWINIRNIVYIFFVLVFVFVGIAVMFRIKIDPRTVMSIQGALPKIIIGLLLVTFSYAIAGFLVDMMRVSLYLTYNTLTTPAKPALGLTPADIQGASVFTAVGKIPTSFGLAAISSDATGGVVGVIKDAVGLGPLGAPGGSGLSWGWIPDPVKSFIDIVGGAVGWIASWVGSWNWSVCIPIPFAGCFNLSIPVGSLLSNIVTSLLSGVINALNFLSSKFISSGSLTYVNLFIHGVSIIAGISAGIQIAQWDLPKVFGWDLGILAGAPIGLLGGSLVFAFTEKLLRDWLPNMIVFFLILGILITALFRVWFALLKCFLYIIIYVIFAPFWIALGLVPGIEAAGFSPWVRGLIANLAAFPVTYALILIAKWFYDIPDTCGGFVPPLIGQSCGGSQFASIFVIGVLLAIPEVINMVKTALKAPQGKIGSSIAAGVAGGTAFAMATPRAGWGAVWGADRMGNAKPVTAFARRHLGSWVDHVAGSVPQRDDKGNPVHYSFMAGPRRSLSRTATKVRNTFGRRPTPVQPQSSTPQPQPIPNNGTDTGSSDADWTA